MRSENFVAFFTVCGFFIGLIFSIITYDNMMDFIFYTATITLFFHIFIHFVLTLFIKADEHYPITFDKNEYEASISEQIEILKDKEEMITSLFKSINEPNTQGA